MIRKLSFLILLSLILTEGRFEFTNVKCNMLDKEFATFEFCFLKSVNRTYKYMSLKVNLLKSPVTKVKVNIALMQKLSGYKPFLYNITVDGCKLMANYKAANPVTKFLFGLFLPFSNINHSCPFSDSIIVEKLPIDYLNTQFNFVLPFPKGDYAFYSNWIISDINRADVRVFFTVS
ncbi:uncharacterized protein [Drosophila tropicalis]|uniref:uncharacterized protein n=1 Tax=Drosophila tropicalis TaxID=46794 RepID=UPI0035AB8BDA